MDSNDRGILTLLAKGLRDLRAQVTNLARQPGPAGKDGRDGKDGLDGKDGIGLRGLAGSDGADGARGQDGPQGAPGVDGERGPMGPMPKHEWKGTQLRFQQTEGRWGKWVDLQGKPGKTGSSGSVYVNSTPGGGSDGREVEVQKSATHIQWRYAGAAVWADLVALTDITGPDGVDGADGDAADIAGETHAATSKSTPVDADELPLVDSAASWGLKKLTFANLKAWIGSLFVSKAGDTITGNLSVTGNTLVTGGGALGYGTGAGGMVTQATSKSTAVTLNKPCGRITTHTASLRAGATIKFIVGNTFVANGDVVSVNTDSLDTEDYYQVSARAAAGLFIIRLTNTSGLPRAEAVNINFAVIKVSTS